ncbi:MAG: transcriptional regulator with XRE-family HTH domain [Pseudohongiellaceae bacterium]|jgi:transcriptional regulator with XRE-family HTH domain
MKVQVNQKKIRGLRMSRGWTQEKLADVSNVHTRTIQRIENDETSSIQSLNAIAEALNVEPEILHYEEAETKANDQRLIPNDCIQPPNKAASISLNERQHAKEIAQEAERLETWLSYEWAGWGVFLIGGFLTVDVLLMTQANLTRTVIFNVFFPGIIIGQLLMFAGAYGIHLAKKAAREKSILATLL